MASSSINTSEDTEMNEECDGDKVVTMMDVLQEQQDFEEDANAVLGASDDKNCTHSKGYVKRQALYACLTCCSEARFDPTKRAGVCLACSLNCHENHELIELYTKRNFCCDCGNSKFNSNPCQFTSDKTDLNEDNVYNQNFSGLYCTCHRPYPDPDGLDDEMIQCIICEDWLHAQHLEATVPSQDQYAEMVCKDCMDKNKFLHDYSELAVNNEEDNLDVVNNSISDVSMNGCQIEIKVNGHEESKEQENKDYTEQNDESTPNDIDMNGTTDQPELALENETSMTNDHLEEAINEQTNDQKATLDAEQDLPIDTVAKIDENNVKTVDNKELELTISEKPQLDTAQDPPIEAEAITDVENARTVNDKEQATLEKPNLDTEQGLPIEADTKTDDDNIKTVDDKEIELATSGKANLDTQQDPPIEADAITDEDVKTVDNKDLELTTSEKPNLDTDISQNEAKADNDVIDNIDKFLAGDDDESEKREDESKPEQQDDNLLQTEQIDIQPAQIENTNMDVEKSVEKKQNEGCESMEETPNVTTDNFDDNKDAKKITNGDIINTENLNDTLVNEQGDNSKTDNKQEVNGIEKQDNVEHELDNKIDEENTKALEPEAIENQSTSIDKTEDSKHMENESSECGLITNGHIEPNEHKRKLSTENSENNEVTMKKSKFDLCIRPKSKKKILNGATFWPLNFRQKLCTCSECISMYKDLSVLFLTDFEDTVTAYETLGKQNGTTTQYERGMEALSSLDRTQQINALTEYNKMRDKLVDFLRSFKDRREVVKEEDIKAFFAGMKPSREPDGVYFCR